MMKGKAAFLIFSFCLFPFSLRAADTPQVTVLCYHTFAKHPSAYAVTREVFESHLKLIREMGYRVVPLSTLVNALYGREEFPDKAVVITIDDGYRSTYTYAAPTLEKFGYPFSIHLYDQFIGGKRALTWPEIRELAGRGVEVGSHSHTHPRLVFSDPEALKIELTDSKAALEKSISGPVEVFTYPYGLFDQRVVEGVKKAGYRAALTCNAESATPQTDPYRIPRFVMTNGIGQGHLRQILETRALNLAHRAPEEGAQPPSKLDVISAMILTPERYDPDSVEMRIDTVGSRKIRPEPGGAVRYPLAKPLHHRFYYVILRARDRASPPHRYQSAWLIRAH